MESRSSLAYYEREITLANITKLIAPPERTVKKTNLDELLAELRNQFTGCLAATKGCEDFQTECWLILIKLEKEAKNHQIRNGGQWRPKNLVTDRDIRRAELEKETENES